MTERVWEWKDDIDCLAITNSRAIVSNRLAPLGVAFVYPEQRQSVRFLILSHWTRLYAWIRYI